ncbi:mannose-6-phosphate isomerase, class I [Schumannella luteola]|uniref:mannose-6-phosphate isomerase n=1 Tax=Schumannella luteola TaxID=472059 RepID=A0A852YA52_9MICO|nr:mannose-6-phosphate isomerase, class I [Schumannella luteola]NYG98742.1 mannose-6-phosphate isomerase [Schumannella luteola]TPX04325.1 mannose-6-phosphate isomerase, class I [Schumannella luteola]
MLVPITNTPRDYAWGSTTAIAELLGTTPSGGPEAELWLGAHPGSPARLVDGTGTLLDVVDGRLPFLLKVLAAGSPLSLQAHPTPQQAEEGFAREEEAGVALDDPTRNYKDSFHKPELIYALSSSFRALCGFRATAETRAVLADAAGDAAIADLIERLGDDAQLRPVFEWLITRGEGVDALIAAVVSASAAESARGLSWDTVRLLADAYPGDPGIVISLLINTVELTPGEVLYLPAGNIHAYLGGLGIELMASSDNVLRGGLTPKHVDVPELLSVLDFRPLPVPYLAPETPRPGVRVFRPDVPDFVLTVVDEAALADGADLALDGRPAIALWAQGSGAVNGEDVAHGGAVYLAEEPVATVCGSGLVFVASLG